MSNAAGIDHKMDQINLESVDINSEQYFKISNSHLMRPFFMSVVSDSNHWMFIASNGGLTAGRKNADNAIFPYYTDDKITESAESTGSKSIFHIEKNGQHHLWEPFTNRNEGKFNYTRNLYKNLYGNKIIFEEVNHDLEVTFRYKWSSSNEFGFIRESKLTNHSNKEINVHLLDGVQNILPSGVPSDLQTRSSNLVDAYKRNELDTRSGLGIFALSAIIVDRAEPSEALKANVVWSLGLDKSTHLLSTLQLDAFRKKKVIKEETDVKAEKGAYLLSKEISLAADSSKEWMQVINVNQDVSQIEVLSHRIQNDKSLTSAINEDIEIGTKRLIQRVCASDGLQLTSDKRRNARHYSNTLFNIMRGGIFDENYQIEKWDFVKYLKAANKRLSKEVTGSLDKLNELFTYQQLLEVAKKSENADFIRLSIEYLPLKFSRRHGDPSRPWNQFSINTRSEIDGSKILDYQGNWRDIFQNWEALALSYPEFIEGMIAKFLNATTFDGYNPYRVTKDGFDWETIEPDDPWSYIGYWGDHQIIYLQKFLEIIESHYPGKLQEYFSQDIFVYANVPYKIKPYDEILQDPKDTIIFDEMQDHAIREQREKSGADGALIQNKNGDIYRVNFIEKILATSLAKLSNFIPEGGIWLNTQRPEWNDANNALVGNGVSMVTLYYLRRFLKFLQELLEKQSGSDEIAISIELNEFYTKVKEVFYNHLNDLKGEITDKTRRIIVDGLGNAGSKYREHIYKESFSGAKRKVVIAELGTFCNTVLEFLDHSIDANKRPDGMYHAYNLVTIENDEEMSISYLSEMLEGQVAVLSSGYLKPGQSLAVLDALKNSKLFRPDQYSYLLYPNKELPKFLEKNVIPAKSVESSELLKKMVKDGDTRIVMKDIHGHYHFNGNFRNANDLKHALDELVDTSYTYLVKDDRKLILKIYEEVFNHKAFTGRSGTFFGYEGLGSIYWHMVSKLLLATKECSLKAIHEGASAEIVGKHLEHFYEINEGIGVHKSPKLYGAFPIDPYSHTPLGKGAQQPGMTGQVKEDILSRIGELGVSVKEGEIQFKPCLLRRNEFLQVPATFRYMKLDQTDAVLELKPKSLAFTYCQVPVIYTIGNRYEISVMYENNSSEVVKSNKLDKETSKKLFGRTGEVREIHVIVDESELK
ncbi:MAG: hypothetical protein Tsb0034_23790 [Ekhidna sp.]